MPVVKMPDGVLVDMPDTPTPEQVQALQQIAGKLEPENPLWHKAKLFGSDVVKGALSLPALAYDLGRDITRGDMPREGSFFPATSALQGSMTQPQTKADQWQSAVTQGVAGALATPAGAAAPVKAAISGGAGGLGSETAASLLGEGPLQRLLGGALGGIGGAATASRIGRAAPQIEELVKQSLKGISPEMLTRAQEFQANALRQGVNTDLAQALSATGAPSEAITAVRNALAHSRYGTQIQAYLHNQPEQLSALADTTVAGLPGSIRQVDVASNNLQQSATDRLSQARQDRSAATRPFYEAAGNLSTKFRTDFANTLSEALMRPGIPADSAAKIREALASLKAAPGTGAAMQHAADYDSLIRELAGPFQGQRISGAGNAFIGDLIPRLKEQLRTASPQTAQGAALHAQLSQDVVDPLKKGLVGYLAGTKGARSDVAAPENKLFTILNKGEDPKANARTGTSNIYQLAGELSKVPDGKASYLDGLKTYISTRVGESLPAEFTGNPATTHAAAQNLYDKLFKNRNQYEGLRQAAAGAAKLMGLPKEDVVRGLDNFGNITFALLNNPKSRGALSERDILDISRKNLPSDSLRMFGIAPLAGPARRIEDFMNRRTFEAFDQLLTTPEGAAKLAELGKAPVMSAKALTLYSTLGGTTPQVSAGANAPGINTQ